MIDVTSQLTVAALRKSEWLHNSAVDNARAISLWAGGVTNWDQDAGEEWIRVLDGARLLALVSVVVPFGFILEDLWEGVSFPVLYLDSAVVSDTGARELTCTCDALIGAFGERLQGSPALSIDCFPPRSCGSRPSRDDAPLAIPESRKGSGR